MSFSTVEAPDVAPLAVYARESGFRLRSVRHWVAGDVDGFRSACALRIGKRWFVDRTAAAEWLEDIRRSGV